MFPFRAFPLAAVLFTAGAVYPVAAAESASPSVIPDEALVEVTRACPGVEVELRYASARNITGKPIYPPGSHAFLRRDVSERLSRAQQILQETGYSLKVWDAYRPPWAQRVLWNAIRDPAYVVEPGETGSLHGWGAAVDVTLVDPRGRDCRMPTDFDAFSSEARYEYRGRDPEIISNLRRLQQAMAEAGFRHIRDEWWHYSRAPLPHARQLDASLTLPEVTEDGPVKPSDPDSTGQRKNSSKHSHSPGDAAGDHPSRARRRLFPDSPRPAS